MDIVTADAVAALVHDGDTLLIGGSGGGHAVPDALLAAVERRFLRDGRPRGITALHPVGLGKQDAQFGASRLAHRGMLRRVVTGTYVDSPPIAELAREDAIEAYTLPQGVLSQLMREMAAGRPGLITHVGLRTFVDPRLGGGRQSRSAREDLVEVVTLAGREWLFYKPYRVDIAFLRGTTADENGNVTMEQEAVFGEMLSMAQAVKRAGGVVVVQVRRLAKAGTLSAKSVKIPGILVDLIVVVPDQMQTFTTAYNPSYAGELRIPTEELVLPFDVRKLIVRRAAFELFPGAICNLGAGISTGLSQVTAEEGCIDVVVLTNEQGMIGGMPVGGLEAGAALNFDAMIDQPYQFDFYDGGGLDVAFLSFAEADVSGNVNVSRFGDRIVGIGGFINISQNAKKVVFSGTFTGGRLDVRAENGRLRILREGRFPKFVSAIEQISYSGPYGKERGQEVLFVTERAVFRGSSKGLELCEVAPGIEIERDIFAQMQFRTPLAPDLREMDHRIFHPEPMGLDREIARKPARERSSRLQAIPSTGSS